MDAAAQLNNSRKGFFRDSCGFESRRLQEASSQGPAGFNGSEGELIRNLTTKGNALRKRELKPLSLSLCKRRGSAVDV